MSAVMRNVPKITRTEDKPLTLHSIVHKENLNGLIYLIIDIWYFYAELII